MDTIKLATPEQVERIRATSDLGPTSAVLAMGEDLAVVKQVTELDPVYFAETSNTSRRLMFIWGIENWLRLTGVPAYYANVHCSDTQWLKVLTSHEMTVVSPEPELRLKRVL